MMLLLVLVFAVAALAVLTPLPPNDSIDLREVQRQLLTFAVFYPEDHPSSLAAGLGHLPCPDIEGGPGPDGPCPLALCGRLPTAFTVASGRKIYWPQAVDYCLAPRVYDNPSPQAVTSINTINADTQGMYIAATDRDAWATMAYEDSRYGVTVQRSLDGAWVRYLMQRRLITLQQQWQAQGQTPDWVYINSWELP